MAFMKPEYHTGLWLEVIAADGDHAYYVPADLFKGLPDAEALKDFGGVPAKDPDEEDGWMLYAVVYGCGVRLSASGYTDCTDWFVQADEKLARAYITELWDVDPDTGDDLNDLNTNGEADDKEED